MNFMKQKHFLTEINKYKYRSPKRYKTPMRENIANNEFLSEICSRNHRICLRMNSTVNKNHKMLKFHEKHIFSPISSTTNIGRQNVQRTPICEFVSQIEFLSEILSRNNRIWLWINSTVNNNHKMLKFHEFHQKRSKIIKYKSRPPSPCTRAWSCTWPGTSGKKTITWTAWWCTWRITMSTRAVCGSGRRPGTGLCWHRGPTWSTTRPSTSRSGSATHPRSTRCRGTNSITSQCGWTSRACRPRVTQRWAVWAVARIIWLEGSWPADISFRPHTSKASFTAVLRDSNVIISVG